MTASRRTPWLPRPLAAGLLLATALACSGGGSGPTAPMSPTPAMGSATFRILGPGRDEPVMYSSGPNLVLCTRITGFADLFIRFAEQTAGNGQSGPRLDIDICNLGDGGTFLPRDPQSTDCGSAQTWGVFWHDPDPVYLNTPGAGSCTLQIQRNGSRLTGNFQCRGMVEFAGSRMIDLVDGSFDCTIG